MKIAMLGQKGIPAAFGGIERHVEELATRLAASGHEVFVYCRKWYAENREQRTENGVEGRLKQKFIPSIKSKHLDAITHTLFSTLHAMVVLKPDIYHYHGVGPALLAWLPRLLRPRGRVIVTFHCLDRKHQKWGLLARLSLRIGEWAACRFAHATITVSRTLQQYCAEVYETKTHYIPNGISVHGADQNSLITRFNLQSGEYLAMVSRLVRHKGAHHLIRAWQRLGQEAPELRGNLKLALVGDSAFTDDYVAELKTLANHDPSIVFTGFQSGAMLEALFANALLMVHPSESEGLPIAVLEAMSYGKVVLASDIPENREVMAEHGFNFPTGNVVALKDKMMELLACRAALPKIGARAREFVIKNYHWDTIAREVRQLYEATLLPRQPWPATS
ncbi:glycosyltransferase family 4 protein [Candidatus Uhrbacteria bacterium]|nr:glycosyltransferase family 4 protein [Candidatus Uhrbacteria bacterium]